MCVFLHDVPVFPSSFSSSFFAKDSATLVFHMSYCALNGDFVAVRGEKKHFVSSERKGAASFSVAPL